MNKTVIASIVIGIVLVGGGVGYYVMQQDKNDSQKVSESQQTQTELNPESAMLKGSLTSLLSQSGAKECTYSMDAESAKYTGTVYFSDGKMRNNYSATKDGKAQTGSMIIMDTQQYVWDNETKKGVKFAFDKTALKNATGTAAAAQQIDVNKEYEFTCKSWSVDSSFYVPPKDVQFQDLAQLQGSIGR